MLGASKRTTLVTFLEVLPCAHADVVMKKRSPIFAMLSRLHPRLYRGIEPR